MELFIVFVVQNILVIGKMINRMDLADNNGLMEQFIKECLFQIQNKEKENLNGMMDLNMLDNLKIIIFKDMVHSFGVIEENL